MNFKVISIAIILATGSVAKATTPQSRNALKFADDNTLFVEPDRTCLTGWLLLVLQISGMFEINQINK